VTVNVAGVDSDALAVAGLSVPLAHDSDTVTLAALLSEKSLLTLNVAELSVFTMVHEAVPPSVMARLAQPAWLAV
jgi:hypothetical protein